MSDETRQPTDKEKIDMYESYLHKINMCMVIGDTKGCAQLIANAEGWSYSHRIGNGRPSEEQQAASVNKAFWSLCDKSLKG